MHLLPYIHGILAPEQEMSNILMKSVAHRSLSIQFNPPPPPPLFIGKLFDGSIHTNVFTLFRRCISRFYTKERVYLLSDGEQYNHYLVHNSLVHYLYTPYMLI
jgi:hypothetical protein